jgi:hypothetical protein
MDIWTVQKLCFVPQWRSGIRFAVALEAVRGADTLDCVLNCSQAKHSYWTQHC